MKKHNPNWLYRSDDNYSAIKAKALRLGYPFTITVREYKAIRPVECHYRHGAACQGYKLLLDTIDPALGFACGNTIFVCERHLGGMNKNLVCANHKHLIEHGRMVKSKDMITNQI